MDAQAQKLSYQTTAYNTLGPVKRSFLLIFLFSYTFDFQGAPGGTIVQYIYAGCSIFSGFLYMFPSSIRPIKNTSRRFNYFLFMWLFLLLSSLIPFYLFPISIDRYIRIIFPYIISIFSIFIVRDFYIRRLNPKDLITLLIISASLSTLWIPIYAIVISGLEFQSIRYQILSPAIPIVFSWAMVEILTEKKLNIAAILLLLYIILLLFLSVTRSYIISGVCLISGLSGIIVRHKSDNFPLFFGRFIKISLWLFFAAIILSVLLRPNIFDTWSYRLFHHSFDSGYDITLVTRLAEYISQIRLLTSDLSSFIFGRGYGAEYLWDVSILVQYYNVISVGSYTEPTYWFSGHSLWIYSIFTGGILSGWIVPVSVLFGTYHSYASIKSVKRSGDFEKYKTSLFICLSLLIYFGQTFTSNPFGLRLGGLGYSLLLSFAFL